MDQIDEYDLLKKDAREKSKEASMKFQINKLDDIVEASGHFEESNAFTILRQNRYRHYVKIIESAWIEYKKKKFQKKFLQSIRETEQHLNCDLDQFSDSKCLQ